MVVIMVCFVHDRQFLSKFHAAVNKLRQTNQFNTTTLRQLPKQCCSCTEKPILTSLDFDTLRLICLRLDLKQSMSANVSSPSSSIPDYMILPFPVSCKSGKKAAVANQFIIQHENKLVPLQKAYDVQCHFLTSNISKELLNSVIQCQYDLVVKCSNYSEAKQAINNLWVIISAKDRTHIDTVKEELYKHWKQFLSDINMNDLDTVDNERENLPPLLTILTCWNFRRAKRSCQTTPEDEEEVHHPVHRISRPRRQNTDEDLVENVLVSGHTRLRFLANRFENSCKGKQPRTHRRQHLLALAVVT